MKLLLDTHAFLFAIADPQQLTARVRAWLTDPTIERWVSVVSIWEIAVKVQIGKLSLPLDRKYYSAHLRALKARPLAVQLDHSLAMLKLPLHHRDPFDRLLIAQAMEEGLTLVTRDNAFSEYSVETVW
jgi:PIN domain nuclease of toxin-antitoxin system